MSQVTRQTTPNPQDTSPSVTRTDIYEMLGNQRRRYALHYIERRGPETVDLRALSDQVAAWENEKSRAELTAAERKRVRTALHQFHLPKLDEAGLVEYDADRQAVALTDEAADLRVYLDVVPGRDVPWGVLYLCIAGVCGLVLAAVWLGVGPVAGVADRSLDLFFLVSVGVTATVHTYYSTRMRLGRGEQPPEVSRR